MYVFVTAAELNGESREQDLGEQPDNVKMKDVEDQVLSRIESDIRPEDRRDSRHFWHNNRLCPDDMMLADIASGNDIVSLELRQDIYPVSRLGGTGPVAINPELSVATVIRRLLEGVLKGRHGAECCYELRVRDGDALEPQDSLMQQQALPYDVDLVLRRKPIFYVWSAALLGLAAVLGLLIGYLSGLMVNG
jgi:hypothetical protein